ncbi:hypothetical protein B0H10DRAFT_1327906 [Mycena sp. CBHHK59/15]|nr:hypothetical protein B0H10DRAFT_1327906 [Mycena sp. CBHHK59/15]
MDPYQVYVAAVLSQLCVFVHVWLEGLRAEWKMPTSLGLAVPYPLYPFPPDFPFNFAVFESFTWRHEYEEYSPNRLESGLNPPLVRVANQIDHVCCVVFRYGGRTGGPGSSVFWEIMFGKCDAQQLQNTLTIHTGPDRLALFEIAGAVCDDPHRPFDIGPDLVLEAMLSSLSTGQPVYVSAMWSRRGTRSPRAVRCRGLRSSGGSPGHLQTRFSSGPTMRPVSSWMPYPYPGYEEGARHCPSPV